MRRTACAHFVFMGAAVLVALVATRDACAQAWVPPKGEGTVAIAFQNMNVVDHLAGTTRLDAGRIDTNVLLADVSYGLTDRIGVDVSMPFVAARYTGTKPHPGTQVDDGSWGGTFTDFRFALRYNLTRRGTVITPYIGTIVPSHDYAFYGHAAPGQDLRELRLGVFTAKTFDRGLPGVFVSGRYSFGFVERVIDVSHNRSTADVEAGYFLTPAFRAFAMTSTQYSHGGIDFPIEGMRALPLPLQPVHDQIQRVHFVNVGAGAAYSLSESFDVFGSFSRQIAGRNGHALNRGVTIGASWSFTTRSKSSNPIAESGPTYEQPNAADSVVARKSLVRCICQKSGS
jgi:hypothetical protein